MSFIFIKFHEYFYKNLIIQCKINLHYINSKTNSMYIADNTFKFSFEKIYLKQDS